MDLFSRPEPNADLRRRWQSVLQELQISSEVTETCVSELISRYSELHRHYHTLNHVQQLLLLIQEFEIELENPALLQLAAWYHDAVYDPMHPDNEAKSAELAAAHLRKLNLPETQITLVNQLILATARHQLRPEADTPDNRFFLDADLAILGTEPAHYLQYQQQIRQEYSFVPEAQYWPARAQVLQNFLMRPVIYHTPRLHQRLEEKARQNLRHELALLSR